MGQFVRLRQRGKKSRQTGEEVGRQHQGMDRPGIRQVPEGSGEQGKMENCGAPTTLAVKELMTMMMVMVWKQSEKCLDGLRPKGI